MTREGLRLVESAPVTSINAAWIGIHRAGGIGSLSTQ